MKDSFVHRSEREAGVRHKQSLCGRAPWEEATRRMEVEDLVVVDELLVES